ncbi:MAG: phosphoserine phosphatase, partial [Candidatus Thermoplasmatota archaeon]|nr:phosphoserine phosphatase [Candidatus Thermoplasmatota archaeon]
MSDLLDEFEQKREIIRKIVEEHIRKRDDASSESHRFAEERDILNNKVREMRDEAKRKIAEKNELIDKVQKLRAEKEEHYKNLSELRKQYRKVREETNVEGFDKRSLRDREKELQRLEIRQQTTLLEKNEEKKVVSEIRKLSKEIKLAKSMREKELEGNDNIKDLTQKINFERK